MASPTIFYASTLEDVFYQLKTIPGLKITGGCSALEELPEKMLSLRGILSLEEIEKHERYIEFGAAVTLTRIEELKETKLPSVLYEAVASVANRHVKNLATIGGNICAPGIRHTLYAPLLALDARLEYQRDLLSTNFIPFSKFSGVSEGWLLSKIRVPVEEWDVALFRRLGPSHVITDTSASFVFDSKWILAGCAPSAG